MSRSTKIDFGPNYERITPETKAELLACEPLEIANMIYQVRHREMLFSQITSRHWRHTIKKIDQFDLAQPIFIPNELLGEWVQFLQKVLQWRENQQQDNLLFKTEQRHQRSKKLLRELKKNQTFAVYLSRSQLIGSMANIRLELIDTMRADEVEYTDLLEAQRWCDAYSEVVSSSALHNYCQQHGLQENSLAKLTYLQLRDLAEGVSQFTAKQELIETINALFGDWRELIANHPSYLRAQNEPLTSLATAQLKELLRELESLSDSGIGFDAAGNLVAKQQNT
ncbi:hypothetical protein H0W80_03740 [Candidatus Saccharibacteria bacterium]|nr:hypothetical protein [Candidatus Saccharibacteria bacterium]